MVIVSHPTYLTSLAPCDFILPMDEAGFESEAFADGVEVQHELLAALDSITIEHFRQHFQQWHRCFQSQAEYCEGN